MSLRVALTIIRPFSCMTIGFAVISGALVSKPVLLNFQNLLFGFATSSTIFGMLISLVAFSEGVF